MHPYGRASSPERKSSSNLGSAFGGFGKGKSKDRDVTIPTERPSSPLRQSQTGRSSEAPESPNQARKSSIETPNGTAPETAPVEASTASAVNGTTQNSIPELIEPLAPPPEVEAKPEVRSAQHFSQTHLTYVQPEKDAEGFSVPPSALDAITEAEREAGLYERPTS